MTGSRSLPVLIVCVVLTLRGLYGFLQGSSVFALSSTVPGNLGLTLLVLGLLVIVLSFAQFLAVGGLWSVRNWGWTVATIVVGLDLLIGVLLVMLSPSTPAVAMAMDVVLLALLAVVRSDFRSTMDREETVPDRVHR